MAHIVNFHPQRRGKSVEYIEEAYPVRNVTLEVRTEREPKSAFLAPSKRELELKFGDGYACCIVPEVLTHQIVVFDL